MVLIKNPFTTFLTDAFTSESIHFRPLAESVQPYMHLTGRSRFDFLIPASYFFFFTFMYTNVCRITFISKYIFLEINALSLDDFYITDRT